jgi:hypothetical protein
LAGAAVDVDKRDGAQEAMFTGENVVERCAVMEDGTAFP